MGRLDHDLPLSGTLFRSGNNRGAFALKISSAALVLAAITGIAAVAAPMAAQTITIAPLACLPAGDNAPVTVQIDPPPPAEVHVRLFFRRLSLQVEDFYDVDMVPTGGGNYWAVFPQPEKSKIQRKDLKNAASDQDLWAQWWKAKEASADRDPNRDLDDQVIREKASLGKLEKRDWMNAEDDATLERYLEGQQYEPAEYYVALIDPSGHEITRSPQQAVPVTDDCRVALTPQQLGEAKNLTVGETARWQAGKPVFHWECSGIVTRRDPQEVLRADAACRACVVGWWPMATAAGALGVVVVTDHQPPEVSPSRP